MKLQYYIRRTYLLNIKEVSVGENKKSKGKIVIGILFKDKEVLGICGYGFTSNFSRNTIKNIPNTL